MDEPTRIELSFPCPKRWSELEGTGPSRHCSACNLAVTNLSLLTRAEAAPVLAQRAERRTCVAFRTDAAGHVVFAESSLRSARWARLARSAAAVLALLFPFLAGCRRTPAAPQTTPTPPETELQPEDLELLSLGELTGY